jgi:hypothetical protein
MAKVNKHFNKLQRNATKNFNNKKAPDTSHILNDSVRSDNELMTPMSGLGKQAKNFLSKNKKNKEH